MKLTPFDTLFEKLRRRIVSMFEKEVLPKMHAPLYFDRWEVLLQVGNSALDKVRRSSGLLAHPDPIVLQLFPYT